MQRLIALASPIAGLLKARSETIAVAESSTGGLISAALLAIPGASAYFLGGGVIYTRNAREALLSINRDDMRGIRSASEPYAQLLAERVRTRLGATWGLAETGAAGPQGNGYGDPPGHSCIALSGPVAVSRILATHVSDRAENMLLFATSALETLRAALEKQS